MSDNQLNFEKWTTLLEPTPPKATEPEAPAPLVEDPLTREPEETTVLSVSDLTDQIKDQIENNFATVWLQGEISNFKAHTSGHFYFNLKDDKAQISAVMFKGLNGRLKFKPDNGMEVIVRGKVTVYKARGNYQISCESMEPVGAGALQKAFEQLKAKLQAEGLFDAKHKQQLPSLPKHIGIVTSPTGAAIQDILNVLGRRYKAAHVTVIPARVQGQGSAEEIVRGIQLANQLACYDVLIVGRGGGSVEDMWCFNEEIVARAIFASKIPIISAVGHEIDFTIADFVADLRAPTPSAAAELVAKSAGELGERVQSLHKRLLQNWLFLASNWTMRINNLQNRLVDPKRRLQDLSQQCDDLLQRLQSGWNNRVRMKKLRLERYNERLLTKEMRAACAIKKEKLTSLMGLLGSLNPLQVLHRGYAVVCHQSSILRSAENVKPGDEVLIQLGDGGLRAKVEETKTSDQKETLWILKKN